MSDTVAVVTAAGSGERLGAGMPKAFVELGGRIMLEHAVDGLLASGVIDRVVVADRIRGQGVGRAIYHDLQTLIGAQWPRIVLEVNLRPANPASSAFHEHVGFRHVGIREHADGREAVTMMERAT